jgi:hypothetical protein
MYEITITTVSQFVTRVEEIKNRQVKLGNEADLLFRGQPCDKPLRPKFGRLETKGLPRKIEELLLNKFAHAHLPFREFESKDKWDLLALAQHHRVPTRLLDWTHSATAALWFAVHNPPEKKDHGSGLQGGIVWVLCALDNDYRELDERRKGGSDPLDNNSATLIYRPNAITSRLVAQSGVFTIHDIIDIHGKPSYQPLEEDPRYKEKLVRLIIPPQHFHTIRKALNMFSANASLLFPDLDGLGDYLSWRYTKLCDEI